MPTLGECPEVVAVELGGPRCRSGSDPRRRGRIRGPYTSGQVITRCFLVSRRAFCCARLISSLSVLDSATL